MLDQALVPVYWWLAGTSLSEFVRNSTWMWPFCETLHFIGLSLLMGTVGLFDLRLIGVARRVPLSAFHSLIPIGVAGFLINVATGICFVAGTPDQFLFNSAFKVKVAFMLLAGLNVSVFYFTAFQTVRAVPAGGMAPREARIMGGVSLCLWIGVIAAGRLLTFYRPIGIPTGP